MTAESAKPSTSGQRISHPMANAMPSAFNSAVNIGTYYTTVLLRSETINQNVHHADHLAGILLGADRRSDSASRISWIRSRATLLSEILMPAGELDVSELQSVPRRNAAPRYAAITRAAAAHSRKEGRVLPPWSDVRERHRARPYRADRPS